MQVPLGVQLKNESKYEDMVLVMEELHKYVPMNVHVKKVQFEGKEVTEEEQQLYPLCVGGDQLSVARYGEQK